MLLLSASQALVTFTLKRDGAYVGAVADSYLHDEGLHTLKTATELMADGPLRPDLQTAACAKARASIRSFEDRWLDSRVYDGHKIHSHVVAAAIASMGEAEAERNGCTSRGSLDAFLKHVDAIRDYDLGIHGMSDLAAWLPVPDSDGYWTDHSVQVRQWSALFSEHHVHVLRCIADAHCDVEALLKHEAEPVDHRGGNA